MLKIALVLFALGSCVSAVAEEIYFQVPVDIGSHVSDKNKVFQYDPSALAWSTLFDYEIKAKGNTARNIANAFLYSEYKANPKGFDARQAVETARRAEEGFRRAFGDWRTKDRAEIRESLSNVIGIAMNPKPTLQNGVTLGTEAYKIWERDTRKWEEAQAMMAVTGRLGVGITGIDPVGEVQNRLFIFSYDIAETARKDRRFGNTIDLFNKDLGLPSVFDLPATMKAKNPQAYSLLTIDEILAATRGGRADVQQLQGIAKDMQRRMNRDLSSLKEKIEAIVEKQTEKTESEESKAEKERLVQELREQFAVAQASARLLTMLAGKLDPEAGRIMKITIEPMLKVMEGINLMRMGAMSSAGFVGLCIAVVTEILEALIGGPSETQLILEAIATLRKELAEFRKEMHDLIGRLDQKMNAMFVFVNERFDALEAIVRNEFLDVKTSLARLERRASIDDRRFDVLEEVFRRADESKYRVDLRRRLNYCLPSGKLELSDSEYRACLNDFYTCASEDAMEPMFTGKTFQLPVPLGVKNASEADALDFHVAVEGMLADSSVSMWNRIALLEDIARTRFGRKLVGDRTTLPNPMTWALCTRAYTDLALRWPQQYRKMLRAGYSAGTVEKPGLDARRALRRIAFPDDNRRVADRGFYQVLLREYRGRVEALSGYLESRRQKLEKEKLSGVSLAVGLTQEAPVVPKHIPMGRTTPLIVSTVSTDYKDEIRQVEQAKQLVLDYPSDESLRKGIPRSLLLAQYLKLGTVKITQEAELPPFRESMKETHRAWKYNGPTYREDQYVDLHATYYTRAELRIKITFETPGTEPITLLEKRFEDEDRVWWEYTAIAMRHTNFNNALSKPWNKETKVLLYLGKEMKALWEKKDGFRAQLEKSLIETPIKNDTAVKLAEKRVTEYLQLAAADLQGQLVREAAEGQLKLNQHLRAISGARRLLEAYVRLGLPVSSREKNFAAALAQLADGSHAYQSSQLPPIGGGRSWFRNGFPAGVTVVDDLLGRAETFEKALEALPMDGPESHPIIEETLQRLAPLTSMTATP